jgi:ceramide glucosyltransferase
VSPWLESLTWLQGALLVPVVVGTAYSLLCVAAVFRFVRARPPAPPPAGYAWPGVSILKPIHGLEKDLAENLRSACVLDYPDYQVVLSVQAPEDPALPILRNLEREFGPERVTVAVNDSEPVMNGKVQNLLGALKVARHEVLLISDSDVRLRRDYLRTIVAPLAEADVGSVCTLYRATGAETWFEKLELLSYNSEFIVNVIFAKVTGASSFCLGCSVALRRKALEDIGGLEPLGEYLVEDFELGRRITGAGYRSVVLPYFVDTTVDLMRPMDWWDHQVYWDQNTRAARPIGFFCTFLIKAVPFALAFALARGPDAAAALVLAGAVAVRLGTVALIFRRIADREGLRYLAWIPARDLAGLGSWLMAICKRTFVWRDFRFELTRDGRIVPRQA